MQRGLGRTGYLLLALFFLLIGALGLGVAYVAFTQVATLFAWIGLGMAGAALLGLYLFASFAPMADSEPRPEPKEPEPRRKREPRDLRMDKEPAFDYEDYEPAPRAAPTEMIVPPAFEEEKPVAAQAAPEPVQFAAVEAPAQAPEPQAQAAPAPQPAPAPVPTPRRQEFVPQDPTQWPKARGKNQWAADMQRKAEMDVRMEPQRRDELTQRYTQNTPTVRGMLSQEAEPDIPEHLADRAPSDMNTDFVAPGMSVGKCGKCDTLLLAPDARPLRLKCPGCAKVTLLK